ncbi:MAG: penicillin-binding protein A [Oscillospiraceae bacterium]|nr:penicillin-binding protein A [Oscillospiraceae bacterium]
MNQNPLKPKLAAVAVFFSIFLLLFFFTLYNTQVIHGSEYQIQSRTSNATTQQVRAARGIITDRNGKLLVGNRLTYTLTLSGDAFSDDAQANDAIARLVRLCQDNDTVWNDSLPISMEPPFQYITVSSSGNEAFSDFLKTKNVASAGEGTLPAPQVIARLRVLFGIPSGLSDREARQIIGVRYELTLQPSYLFANDVSVALISQIVDGHFPGVTADTASAREYYTPYAAHILGRISRIYAEDWDKYKDLGYSMNALVGSSGTEAAFESYLHGTDGTRLITTDENGRITGELYTVPPKPGNAVALTLDIDLQRDVEETLGRTIDAMIEEDGIQRGGGAVVMKVGTGEVLALASYPTFDLAHFDQIYSDLLDDPRLPMFNRATDGIYAPGSTFKPCTAVAALESGIITPTSKILTKGIYTYYAYPQPTCWIYGMYHGTHGSINVSTALTVSCNYFFFEVGRLMGIDTLTDYATQFGLGQHTGIEIGDSAGALASPEYAAEHDLEWTDGQTLTAAIGQSYNLFTPLQLANYTATLASGGEHYRAHLLKDVKAYDNSSLVFVCDEEPLNVVEMSESTKQAVRLGMRNLVLHGNISSLFTRCIVPAAAKTGTAQVGTEINNGVLVAYAPYDNPEIAVAVVIEKGGGGYYLGNTVVDIINSYFSRDGSTADTVGENTLLK